MDTFKILIEHYYPLVEKFFDGVKGSFEYTEIFKDPTLDEIGAITKDAEQYTNVSPTGAYLQYFDLAAMITPKHLYVWSRDKAEHKDVWPAMDQRVKGLVYPAYVHFYPKTKDVVVRYAPYTSGLAGPAHPTGPAWMAFVKGNPAFKVFHQVKIEPYLSQSPDEDPEYDGFPPG